MEEAVGERMGVSREELLRALSRISEDGLGDVGISWYLDMVEKGKVYV